MNHLLSGNQSLTRSCQQCQNKAKNTRPRHLHQSTLNLGDTAPCFTTTHTQSYSGRSADGCPLIFHLRDPSFPSQHHPHLDLCDNLTPLQRPPLTHSTEVYRPHHITPRPDLKGENWARYRSGQAVREVTNPQDPPEYWTTYTTDHSSTVTNVPTQLAGGRPTEWHQHNILTGEPRQTAVSRKHYRKTRDKLLWAARRWERDCSALRLY
ncbi:hypothetical protein Q5P01_016843 [Channa striata]|uniref:Uncharacterized protein n=1 Tax=Channa striata TaxID=64152 RepID=A0AA88SAV1_CHASR|nr:hypothetical protein Q5P01_016843 [Channa striata]